MSIYHNDSLTRLFFALLAQTFNIFAHHVIVVLPAYPQDKTNLSVYLPNFRKWYDWVKIFAIAHALPCRSGPHSNRTALQ